MDRCAVITNSPLPKVRNYRWGLAKSPVVVTISIVIGQYKDCGNAKTEWVVLIVE